MWLIALFDLPTIAVEDKVNYTRFRASLLKAGFSMLQFSVYARYCVSEEAAKTYRRRIRASLPPAGQVRVIALTDHQFRKMEVFQSKKRIRSEPAPEQLLLF